MKNLWRQVLKNKSHTFINLFGLSLALTVCSFILLYVQDEWSYDKYLTGHDRILRLQPLVHAAEGEQEWATSEGFIVPSLKSMYPEIESAARLLRSENEVVFTIDTVNISQESVIAADSTLFEVFPFEFIYGDRNTAFEKPQSIVVSAEVAKKFFGNTDPIGRTLVTESSVFEVTGVFKDIPSNSHFHFKVVLPLRFWFADADHSHNMYAFYSYIRLTPSAQPEIFIREVLKGWYEKYGYQTPSEPRETTVTLSAKPIADIHLQSRAEREFESNGQLQLVWTFSAVALLILVIATINYINLSNAMAIRRAKEVAVRKTVGASRRSLFFSFIIESYSFTLAAFVISIGAVMLLLGRFNLLTGKHFSYQTLADPKFMFTLLTAWMVLGFLSGFYPATILSSFRPVQALKSNSLAGRSGKFSLGLRRGLIVFQFAISSFMIVCSFTIHQQLKYIDTRNVGFNKNDIMVVTVPRAAHDKLQELKTEIQKLPAVESVSISSVVPGKRVVFLTVRIPALAGIKPNVPGTDDGTRDMRVLAVDHDFVKTFGLTIVEGRDFAIENPADVEGAFLLNEAAVKQFNLKDPVGTPFEYVFREQKKGFVIGVVKDFNFASIHTPVEPLVLHYQSDFFSTLSIRLKSADNVPATIAEIESTWKHVADVSFRYNFLETAYDNLYRSERVTGKVIATLTALALMIACLGLFGIVSFFVAQRTREVGIRKVFGASQLSLFRILSNEYTFMVIVGNLIAYYPSWLMSQRWLEQFSYRAEFSWFIYLIAFATSSVLAIVSIAHVIINTSKANPAAILRSE